MSSIATYSKPVPSTSLPDWHCRVWSLRQEATTRTLDAFNLRYAGGQLRNEISIRTKWDTHHNDLRLEDRLGEMCRWRDVLCRCLGGVREEERLLTEEKLMTEKTLEKVGLDFCVLSQCMSLRDTRLQGEIVLNGVDCELQNELGVLEAVKSHLRQRAHEAWEQLTRLGDARFRLETDLANRECSIAIDTDNRQRDINSDNISYKPDALRIPPEMVSYESWLETSRYNKQLTDNEIAHSEKLRESLEAARKRVDNDVMAQHEAADYALRNRIYQVQRAKNEMEWQRIRTTTEMEKVSEEIGALERAVMGKGNALKLAETRLERRLQRPGAELVRDEAHVGLSEEVVQLRSTSRDLQERLDAAKAAYNGLEALLLRLEAELAAKQHALCLDLRCQDVRRQLYSGERAPPPTQSDRNVQLVRLEQELPPAPQ